MALRMAQRGAHGALVVVRLRQRGIEPGHDRIAYKFIDGAAFGQDGLNGNRQVAVEGSIRSIRAADVR